MSASQKKISDFFVVQSRQVLAKKDANISLQVEPPPLKKAKTAKGAPKELPAQPKNKPTMAASAHDIHPSWYQHLKHEFERPYYTQAHGLCFSVRKGVKPPPSLANMFKELTTDISGFTKPEHGCLDGWARQGVLLLNACLTVETHKPNSHKDKGWEKLTDSVIRAVSANLQGVVFLLWGGFAQKKSSLIDKKKHHILLAPHPSPLSAHRGFLGCKHFSQSNKLLMKQGKQPIDWADLP